MVPAGVGGSCSRPKRVLTVGGKTIDEKRAVVHLDLLNDGVVMTGQVGCRPDIARMQHGCEP
jgi:hypothetical protein